MENMKVSAVIPTYNRPEATLRALDSILSQTSACDEVIVVDDASTDHSLESLKIYCMEHPNFPLKLVTLPVNKGVSAARNAGIEAASHPWIAFLDSDDEWVPEKLEIQMNSLKDSSLLISHTDESWLRNGKTVKRKKKHQKFGGRVFDKAVKMCFIGPSTSIVHASVFNRVGLFDESFVVCEDYDLWLRTTSIFDVDYVPQKLLIKHGGHEDQLSTSFKGMDYWRARALKKQLDNSALSYKELSLVRQEFECKIKLLMDGCHKHQNLELMKKVRLLQATEPSEAFETSHI